jgi:hypothetical protein
MADFHDFHHDQGDDYMADESEEILIEYFARLHDIKQKTAKIAVDHASYQALLRELNLLEKEGIKVFSDRLQAARDQNSFVLVTQIEEALHGWEKENEDLLKLLHRKSPRGY